MYKKWEPSLFVHHTEHNSISMTYTPSIRKTALGYAVIALLVLGASFAFIVWQSTNAEETPFVFSELDAEIARLGVAITDNPSELKNYIELAYVYLQKVRETGDASYYTKIDELLAKAETANLVDADIDAVKAMVANGRHDPARGYEWIKRAITKNPTVSSYYGIKVDSEIELGKYEDAIVTLQGMVDKKPNFSSFTRIAYVREIHGDTEGAIEALSRAVDAGSAHKENVAWAHVESGKLWARSDLEKAQHEYFKALEQTANYAPALEGLGRIAWAKGDQEKAKDFFEKAFETLPVATYAIDLGKVYSAVGDEARAKQYFVLAELAFDTSAVSGVDIDLEYSLFLSDHGDPWIALVKAVRAYKKRPTIYGADALAWALYKNGKYTEAKIFINEAVRLGEHDPQIVFHAAMISQKLGELEKAEELLRKVTSLDSHPSLFYSVN